MHLGRIERAIRGIWPQVTRAVGAIDRLVRLLERQAKLLALDAPIEVAVSQETRDTAHRLLHDLEVRFNSLLAERDERRQPAWGPEGNGADGEADQGD